MPAMFASVLVIPVTSCPVATSWRTSGLPIAPLAPATKTLTAPSFAVQWMAGMDRRSVTAGLAALSVALGMPGVASGGSAGIAVEADGANKFAPKVASFTLISSNFYWYWGAGGVTSRPHNVRQDDRLFRSGAPTKNGGNISFSVSAGTFPYFCEVHGGPGGRGMSGKVKVPPKEGSPEPDGVPVSWAVDASTTGSRYA